MIGWWGSLIAIEVNAYVNLGIKHADHICDTRLNVIVAVTHTEGFSS